MWAAQYFHFDKPRRWINSGGLGTMGFGLPAAMGAEVGCPDETVVCISGDGSIQMNTQELATCAENGHRRQGRSSSTTATSAWSASGRSCSGTAATRRSTWASFPDFVKLAEAYGCTGVRLTDKTTLVQDVREAIETPGPVVVDVRVTREENTYPMIAPGAAARDMVGERRWASQERRRSLSPRELEAPAACGRAASTSCRSSWRTSPAC